MTLLRYALSHNAPLPLLRYERTFSQCGSTGRTTNFNNVLTVQDVSQIGEDPLVVFDGLM